jgi:APA family basic amino acid/polyamine antiporter
MHKKCIFKENYFFNNSALRNGPIIANFGGNWPYNRKHFGSATRGHAVNQTLGQKLIRTKTSERKLEDASQAAHGGGLNRTLGLFPLTMIGVGATIGTGIFFTMVEAVPKAGPAVVLSFLMAAITAGLTALCYAELADRVPASGSSYSFAYATVGEFAAFIVAACLLLEYGLAGSATAIGWSDYLNNFLQNAFGWQIPDALRSPMIVSGKQAASSSTPGTSTCRPSCW